MAELYYFFNSTSTDRRKYRAQDLADYFGDVLSTGLLHVDGIPFLGASVETGTLNTVVSPGRAIMKGHRYVNTTPLTLAHDLPEINHDRIDRIVLRLNLNNAVRNIRLHVLSGTPSENPEPPSLTRTDFIYEISLAQVVVRKNTVQLLPGDLTDERLDNNVCGLVYSLISVPTEVFQEQWDNFLQTVNDEGFVLQGDFNEYKSDNRIYKTVRLNEDENGIFTVVERRRTADNTLIAKTELSGGVSPNYTTRTITYYAQNGTSILDQVALPVVYNENGDMISEG